MLLIFRQLRSIKVFVAQQNPWRHKRSFGVKGRNSHLFVWWQVIHNAECLTVLPGKSCQHFVFQLPGLISWQLNTKRGTMSSRTYLKSKILWLNELCKHRFIILSSKRWFFSCNWYSFCSILLYYKILLCNIMLIKSSGHYIDIW